MPPLFRRPTQLICFFCQSAAPPNFNPRHFRCPSCGCWNRFDQHGEILSDEPAMHDESLNSRSFAKRASPRKDRLPTTLGPGPFCHTCQTNQMLLINLLSNYLPPSENPEYAQRLEMMPSYRESLEARYPPVCNNCLPAVEDTIQKKDHMARTQALGKWLNETRGKDRQRRVSAERILPERKRVHLLAWKIRGALWAASSFVTFVGYLSAALGYTPLSPLSFTFRALPFLVLISVLWTFWDYTYPKVHRAQVQGRDVRVQGKRVYIALQSVTLLSRLVTAGLLSSGFWGLHVDIINLQDLSSQKSRIYYATLFITELTMFAVSFMALQVQHPPAIRLLDTAPHKALHSRAGTPLPPNTRAQTPIFQPLAEDDIMASLTLSSKPVLAVPKFGMPSLRPSAPPKSEGDDSMAMDWSPTDPAGEDAKLGSSNDSPLLRPQRFFGPEKPTGLEGLFERTTIIDLSEPTRKSKPRTKAGIVLDHPWLAVTASLLPRQFVAEGWFLRNRKLRLLPPLERLA
ncbi:hypothetical protein BDN72DRAFT_884803 [Pluteus cervinus]|uniref:Uncharacterized protein n=1 Tax=Pluteus cervinus TaxID=181527 RepID=A0ACD3BGU0_9AGAR|nr:hypothetical protein BDN72DRAFT_884803 [Pluteus cervinus]